MIALSAAQSDSGITSDGSLMLIEAAEAATRERKHKRFILLGEVYANCDFLLELLQVLDI
jgi:hypothetical protein